MAEAVRNYAAYSTGRYAWALGRFIVPAGRLDEFSAASASRSLTQPPVDLWRLSALVGEAEIAGDIVKANAFNHDHRATARVDTLEFRAATVSSIEKALPHLDRGLVSFVEIPIAGEATSTPLGTGMPTVRELLEAIKGGGSRAKIRTGGVTVEAFPEPVAVARFLEQSAAANVPFKATAGLHHPMRGQYPLTYEAHSPTGTMHGFLNLLLSAAFAHAGWKSSQLTEVLVEASPSAFRFEWDNASWRGHHLTTEDLRVCREGFLFSFGSCSFEEPIRELESAGWLPE